MKEVRGKRPAAGGLVRGPASVPVFESWLWEVSRMLLARPFVGYRKRRLAQSTLLEALSKAWQVWARKPKCFCSRDHLRNWLRYEAWLRTLDGVRRLARRRTVGLPQDLADPRSRRRRLHWSEEDCRVVWLCLQRLPAKERLVLEGHYYDGQTDVELGLQLYGAGKPSALGQRAFRLRHKAEDHLGAMLVEEGVGKAS